MVKRHKHASFGSTFAFPGGVLEDSDSRVHAICSGVSADARAALNAGSPKRYSTRFFLAEVPKAQAASHDGGELTESCWIPVAEILKARKNKVMKVPYPTRKTLKRLARFDSTSPMLEWARACGENGVICDQPAFSPEELA